jgi:hypothetical protein
MLPPERYSVHPPSFAARLPGSPKPVHFPTMFVTVWRWCCGVRPDFRQIERQRRLIDRMVAEAEDAGSGP